MRGLRCPPKDKQIALDIAAGAVQPADTEPFKQEPAIAARAKRQRTRSM